MNELAMKKCVKEYLLYDLNANTIKNHAFKSICYEIDAIKRTFSLVIIKTVI